MKPRFWIYFLILVAFFIAIWFRPVGHKKKVTLENQASQIVVPASNPTLANQVQQTTKQPAISNVAEQKWDLQVIPTAG